MTQGKGGYVQGYIKMSKSSILYIFVGNGGQKIIYPTQPSDDIFNGGGAGKDYNDGRGSGFGGGATAIRTISGTWNNVSSLRSRIIVAAGGGGVGGYNLTSIVTEYYRDRQKGGRGGGLSGYIGETAGYDGEDYLGGNGTQVSGGIGIGKHEAYYGTDGLFGAGGSCLTSREGNCSGGGGGWYGGSSCTNTGGAGGGGSSYISGHTGSVGVTSTSDSSPKSGCTTGTTNNACSLTPYINPATGTSYTFTNTLMIDGSGYAWTNTKGSLQQMPNPNGGYYASGIGHSGNGAARITYLGTSI